ncbi:MAG: porphobilinogen synthase [Candidatus Omnitrophota bacterium]
MEFDLNDLIYPLFIKEGSGIREPIETMPNLYRHSPDTVIREIKECYDWGINKFILFGIAKIKDVNGSSAYSEGNLVALTVQSIKKQFPKTTIITDICLCAYTSHGHCGILDEASFKRNEELTQEVLSRMALSHAAAGADVVAPSAVLSGEVGAIRHRLDNNGFSDTAIMGYSAKFASNFYGAFRVAVNSSFDANQRRGYQHDYNQIDRALCKVEQDIAQGADIIMVKPALSYLDIIAKVKTQFRHKLAAYNVSGEYAMVKSGAIEGIWNEQKMVYEVLAAIKRAGADLIISYHTKDVARWQSGEKYVS